MAHGMTRREFAATTAGLAALGFGARVEGAATKTLRLIASSDLRVLDPIWTTAGISRAHGYMVFDTPFALSGQITSQLHPILALLGPPPISLVDMYVLHSDLLLAFAAVTIECIEQHRMRAGELVRLGLRF
jgi:hypothetical protein